MFWLNEIEENKADGTNKCPHFASIHGKWVEFSDEFDVKILQEYNNSFVFINSIMFDKYGIENLIRRFEEFLSGYEDNELERALKRIYAISSSSRGASYANDRAEFLEGYLRRINESKIERVMNFQI